MLQCSPTNPTYAFTLSQTEGTTDSAAPILGTYSWQLGGAPQAPHARHTLHGRNGRLPRETDQAASSTAATFTLTPELQANTLPPVAGTVRASGHYTGTFMSPLGIATFEISERQ